MRHEATAQILRDAAALIDNGWCQNAYAARADGVPADYMGKDADTFCARGAVARAARTAGAPHLISDACEALEAQIDECHASVIDWNDAKGRTVGDVQLAFKKAIAAAEAGAQL